jgi:hypothetical protein
MGSVVGEGGREGAVHHVEIPRAQEATFSLCNSQLRAETLTISPSALSTIVFLPQSS